MMPTAPTEEYTWILETCSVFIIINCRYYNRLVGLVVVDSSKHNNPCLHSHFYRSCARTCLTNAAVYFTTCCLCHLL
jgi:hypothetical protein